jgi:hypothetical protein
MGKFKLAKANKKRTPSRTAGAIPCLILVFGAILLFSLMIYGLLSTNAP